MSNEKETEKTIVKEKVIVQKDPLKDPPIEEDDSSPRPVNFVRNIILVALAVLLAIALIFGIIWLGKQVFANGPSAETTAPVNAPVSQNKPTWVESWTVSPVSTDNFVVEYGDWRVTTNDLYTFGDRTVDVTIVVNNSSNKIVVINYSGMNWESAIQVKPGERTTFTGKAGDFRVTLLEYKNQ